MLFAFSAYSAQIQQGFSSERLLQQTLKNAQKRRGLPTVRYVPCVLAKRRNRRDRPRCNELTRPNDRRTGRFVPPAKIRKLRHVSKISRRQKIALKKLGRQSPPKSGRISRRVTKISP